jgi:periplasmic protein TonB
MSSRNIEDDVRQRRSLPWTIGASLLLHGVAYATLGAGPTLAKPEHRKTQLRFDVVQQRPKPVDVEPKPAPVAPSKPKPRAAEPKPQLRPELPPPAATASEPTASEGVTLAGDASGNAFSMPLGNGGPLEPTRSPVAAPLDRPARVAPPTRTATEATLVAVGDLSTRPSPPALELALERNYPADARRRGLSGTAKVRARIDPDGVVRQVTLIDESALGFGGACRRTLSGSRWAAPKDKAGRSVATEIRYTCRFVVQP